MIGMDCDRPRGEFINSKEGTSMAERKINSIEKISSQLHKLDLPRTFSICGSFLESMSLKFGKERMADAFNVKDDNGCQVSDAASISLCVGKIKCAFLEIKSSDILTSNFLIPIISF